MSAVLLNAGFKQIAHTNYDTCDVAVEGLTEERRNPVALIVLLFNKLANV